MSKVTQAREKLRGLLELDRAAYRSGDPERVVDLRTAEDRAAREVVDAKSRLRAENAAVRAELVADGQDTRARVADDSPAGWSGTAHTRLSPGILRRVAEADAAEAVAARRAERERAADAEIRRQADQLARWRADVALGLAAPGDLRDYTAGRAGGRTPGEAIAAAAAAQDAEDQRARSAVQRYGEAMLAAFGPDVSNDGLDRLLFGEAAKVPAGERGWA